MHINKANTLRFQSRQTCLYIYMHSFIKLCSKFDFGVSLDFVPPYFKCSIKIDCEKIDWDRLTGRKAIKRKEKNYVFFSECIIYR